MTKHTPGPWEYDKGTDGAVIHAGVTIANVPQDATAWAANARLIAAAPYGLAANKAALSAILVAEQLGEICPDTFAETKATLRAAIAKAEGGAL